MQDGDISPTEFHKVWQGVEKYRKLKADIRKQAKARLKQINEEQREKILKQGRKEGIEDLYVRYPGCQYHLKSASALRHVILWPIKTIKINP